MNRLAWRGWYSSGVGSTSVGSAYSDEVKARDSALSLFVDARIVHYDRVSKVMGSESKAYDKLTDAVLAYYNDVYAPDKKEHKRVMDEYPDVGARAWDAKLDTHEAEIKKLDANANAYEASWRKRTGNKEGAESPDPKEPGSSDTTTWLLVLAGAGVASWFIYDKWVKPGADK